MRLVIIINIFASPETRETVVLPGGRRSDNIDHLPVQCAVHDQLAVGVGHHHHLHAGVDVQADAGLPSVVGHQTGLTSYIPDLDNSISTSWI